MLSTDPFIEIDYSDLEKTAAISTLQDTGKDLSSCNNDLLEELFELAYDALSLQSLAPKHQETLKTLQSIRQVHSQPDAFKLALLPLIKQGWLHFSLKTIEGFFKKHRDLMSSSSYSVNQALALFEDMKASKALFSKTKAALSSELDGLLQEVSELLPENLERFQINLSFNISDIADTLCELKKSQIGFKKLLLFLESQSRSAAVYALYIDLKNSDCDLSSIEKIVSQLQENPILKTFEAQSLANALKKLEQSFLENVKNHAAIDAFLPAGGRRLHYLAQGHDPAIVFNPGFCRGGVRFWARQFPVGAIWDKSPECPKLVFKSPADLHETTLTQALLALQLNQGFFLVEKKNTTHIPLYVTEQEFPDGIFRPRDHQSLADSILEKIEQCRQVYAQLHDIPVIDITLLGDGTDAGHAIGFKAISTKGGFIFRFLDFNYGEFEFDSFEALSSWFHAFLRQSPYLEWYNHFKLSVLLPRDSNQDALHQEFFDKMAHSKHPTLCFIHQAAHRARQDKKNRMQLKVKLFEIIYAEKNTEAISIEAIEIFHTIFDPSEDDKMGMLLLASEMSDYFKHDKPEVAFAHHLEIIKIALEMQKLHLKDARWHILLANFHAAIAQHCASHPDLQKDYKPFLDKALGYIEAFHCEEAGQLKNEKLALVYELAQQLSLAPNVTPFELTRLSHLLENLSSEGVMHSVNPSNNRIEMDSPFIPHSMMQMTVSAYLMHRVENRHTEEDRESPSNPCPLK